MLGFWFFWGTVSGVYLYTNTPYLSGVPLRSSVHHLSTNKKPNVHLLTQVYQQRNPAGPHIPAATNETNNAKTDPAAAILGEAASLSSGCLA